MQGKYLKEIDSSDRMRDPTMTHVIDPWVFRVGDCLQDGYGWSRIIGFDADKESPRLRFAYTERIRRPKKYDRCYDLRDSYSETRDMNEPYTIRETLD